MFSRVFFGWLLSILLVPSFTVNAEEVVLNKEVLSVIKKFNPSFVNWQTKNYSQSAQKAAKENKGFPFYLELDVNNDDKLDLVIDGHDATNSILICLVSNSRSYKVHVVNVSELIDPANIDSWNDGINEKGLNYYFWPSYEGNGFRLIYPQQSDTNGKLLMDGEVIDYFYENSVFRESALIM